MKSQFNLALSFEDSLPSEFANMTMLISYQMLIQKQLTCECDVPLTMFPIIIIKWIPTFVKKRAKKVLAERSADIPPNMVIDISLIFDSLFLDTNFDDYTMVYSHFKCLSELPSMVEC